MRFVAVVAAALALASPAHALTVYAASSLTDVFPQIDPLPHYSFGGSDTLAFQIRQGAPADVFAAASPKSPNALFADGLVGHPRAFATNRVVLIVPRANPARIARIRDLRRSGIKLVVAQPGVPIGDYTRQALARLGLSGVLRNVVSEETDVRNVVAKVSLGEADAGFVYATDARAVGRSVRTIALPAAAQPKVVYEIAIVRPGPEAVAFVRRVLGPVGRARLRAAGFGVP